MRPALDLSCDVAIVGYGPTGATLANLLAQNGLSVIVIEREAEMYHLPRAVHFDDEVMRVFQTVGIADALVDLVHVNPGMRFVDMDGTLLLDWPRPAEVGPHGWNASYRLHQPDLERLLRARLDQEAGAQVLTRTRLDDIEERDAGVHLRCADVGTGVARRVKASYVIGCDGARSTLRSLMAGTLEDLGFQERWLVVDVILREDRPDLGDFTIQYCNPDRPLTYCRSPGQRRRWEITLRDDETEAQVTDPDWIWQALRDWVTPEGATLERAAVYTFRSAIADRWRKGRLLIAGDAAHLTPPFMGQGMCTGIRDAANLGWKLLRVIKGQSGADLLNSYQSERAPHARHYIETAMRLGHLINSLDRQAALDMASTADGGRAMLRSVSPRLGAAEPLMSTANADPEIGRLFPQPRLSDGRRMDDVTGYAPLLISDGQMVPNLPRHPCVLDARAHPELLTQLQSLGVAGVVLRPDRYVAAVARTAAELTALSSDFLAFACNLPVDSCKT